MDATTLELIDALTTELERCEGTITRLYVTLDRSGLADESLADAVHERKAAILALVLKVRGDGVHPAIVPIEGL